MSNESNTPPPPAPHPADITDLMAQMANLMSQFVANPNQQQRGSQQQHRSSKPVRPTIEADSSDNNWIIFEDSWSRYKQMANLTDQVNIRNELRSTCSSKVNEMLFNFVGPEALNTSTEEDLLKYIKSVAVKTVHSEVYRQQFFNLRQSDCETITCFISRLKAQAMLCDFKTDGTCNTQNCSPSYAKDMIRSQLIAGIRNPTHQSKVLSEIASLQTLEDITSRLLALEATDRASSQFRSPFENLPSDVAPIKSPYPKQKQQTFNQGLKKLCSGCGKPHHQGGRSTCPAWEKICHKCKKPNHFANVCRSNTSNIAPITEDPQPSISHISSINTSPI